MTRTRRITKRCLDLSIAVPMLVVCAMPLAVAALCIKAEDGGAIFFRQVRVGRGGTPFRVWKFRTMSVMQIDPKVPDRLSRDDERITRVGGFLRGLGIDELPQLLNVLAGEMSLVGPRPTLAYQVERYDDVQRRRLEVKPGITSLAIVSGRNALSWAERIELDVWYVDHASIGLDIKILFKTLWKVLVTREGLYGLDGTNDTFVEPRDPL
jgi:lipopolysaccharide/colanic/teichoic acid biosynthesis glycosyltransferase